MEHLTVSLHRHKQESVHYDAMLFTASVSVTVGLCLAGVADSAIIVHQPHQPVLCCWCIRSASRSQRSAGDGAYHRSLRVDAVHVYARARACRVLARARAGSPKMQDWKWRTRNVELENAGTTNYVCG